MDSFGASRFPRETPAPLVIRSPTTGMEDVDVTDANLGWTVKQLKTHITEVHPAHPSCGEQKLVYSGRLLQDHMKLCEVLRQFQPGGRQFMHLVVSGEALARTAELHSAASAKNSSPSDRRTPERAGLRQRHQPVTQAAVSAMATSPAATSPAAPTPAPAPVPGTALGGLGSPGAVPYGSQTDGSEAERKQWYAASQHLIAYAQQVAAMGYPPALVQQYMHQAHQYYAAAATPPRPSAASRAGGPHVAPAAAAAPEAAAGSAAPVSGPAVTPATDAAADPVAANADAALPENNNNGLPEDHRFAQAGMAAEPAFMDRDEARNDRPAPLARMLLNQVMLISKLALFMLYFGANATGIRYKILCMIVFFTFVWQGGWVRRLMPRRRRREPRAADVVDAAAAAGDAGVPADDAGAGGNAAEPQQAARAASAAAAAAAAAASAAAAAAERPPAPMPGVAQLVGSLVYRFFASLVPGAGRELMQ